MNYPFSSPSLPFSLFRRNSTTSCQNPSCLLFRLTLSIEEKEFMEGASLDRRWSFKLRLKSWNEKERNWTIIIEWKLYSKKATLKFHTLLKMHKFQISRDPSIMRSINKPPLISLIQPNLELKTFSPASLLSITASTYPRWNIYRRMKIGWEGGKKLEKFHHQNSNSSTRRENCHFELAGSRGGGEIDRVGRLFLALLATFPCDGNASIRCYILNDIHV